LKVFKLQRVLSLALLVGFLSSITIPASAADCTPTESTIGSDTVLTFANVGSCDWTVPAGVSSVRALVVAGGGAGGGGWTANYFGNGGGGGEVIDTTLSVNSGSSVSIKVGAGGAATSYDTNSTSVNNGDTSFFGTTTARAGTSTFDKTSRVGGTSGSLKAGGTGGSTVVEGGGGGGAGSNGSGRNGGAGVSSNISGTSREYGGGGASMGHNGATPQYGTATGGGGAPTTYSVNVKGTATATANTGGGGGGDNGVAGGGAGGSGVVVVRFATPGVPTWGSITSNTPNRSPDGYGCQWQFLPAVNENGSSLTNYLVTIRTDSYTGAIVREDMPASPAQTSTTLVQLDRNFFSSFGASANVTYYFSLKPINGFGAAAERKKYWFLSCIEFSSPRSARNADSGCWGCKCDCDNHSPEHW
jgi:hypothetical protein